MNGTSGNWWLTARALLRSVPEAESESMVAMSHSDTASRAILGRQPPRKHPET